MIKPPANKMAAIATMMRHNILSTVLIVVKVYNRPTCKNSKNIAENP
jgi:hypothetical protein